MSFRRLTSFLGLSYIKKRPYFDNNEQSKDSRFYFATNLLNVILDKRKIVLFFDTTSLADKSLKQNCRSYKTNPNSCKPLFVYNMIHLLFLMNEDGYVLSRFIKGNMSSFIILDFFQHAIQDLLSKSPNKDIVVVLDNATMHKTRFMKAFAMVNLVTFLFFPPKNPFLNPAEFGFRFVKADLKKKITSISKIISDDILSSIRDRILLVDAGHCRYFIKCSLVYYEIALKRGNIY